MAKIYIAGPMRGIAEFNFPAFFAAADKLRSEGHEVFSPAERDINAHGDSVYKGQSGDLSAIANTGFNLREALADDLTWVCREADAVYMLPGWETSKGATAEWATARALGLDVIYG